MEFVQMTDSTVTWDTPGEEDDETEKEETKFVQAFADLDRLLYDHGYYVEIWFGPQPNEYATRVSKFPIGNVESYERLVAFVTDDYDLAPDWLESIPPSLLSDSMDGTYRYFAASCCALMIVVASVDSHISDGLAAWLDVADHLDCGIA